MATMVLNNTLIQAHTDATFRGRVMVERLSCEPMDKERHARS
jgi:hypothetical protein